MVLALTTGFLLALGHHLFYAGLAGKPASTGEYSIVGASVSKQQFNTAVGTAFAFFVKAALALAVFVAYVQAFWRAAQTSKTGMRLSVLDATCAILTNITGIFKMQIWVKHPILFLLAAVVWTIPIASIITPATLSIHGALVQPPPSALTNVPQLDFTSYDFVAPLTYPQNMTGSYNTYRYRGPAQLVDRVAAAVGAQGQILPITPPAANASWTLDFWGPSLRCSNVEGQDRQDIWDNVAQSLNSASSCSQSWGYVAWAPTLKSSLPFIGQNGSASTVLSSLSLSSGTPAMLYVAALPEMWDPKNAIDMPSFTYPAACAAWDEYGKDTTAWANLFANATLLRCMFLNTSYHAAFDYIDGAQTVSLEKMAYSDPATFVPVGYVTGPASGTNGGSDETKAWSDMANKSCSTLNQSGKDCDFDPVLLRTLAYQGVVDAFGQLVRGTISLGDGPDPTKTYNSNIVKTVLLDTDELTFIDTWNIGTQLEDLTALSAESNGTDYLGLSNNYRSSPRGHLDRTMEELFQNLTISLLNEASLRANYSSVYAPTPRRNVTSSVYHNVYAYDKQTLWIAYGLAIAFASFSVMVGLAAVLFNQASYDTNFSTILRVSQASNLSEQLREGDGKGSQPLPKHLTNAKVMIYDRRHAKRTSEKSSSLGSMASSDLQSSPLPARICWKHVPSQPLMQDCWSLSPRLHQQIGGRIDRPVY